MTPETVPVGAAVTVSVSRALSGLKSMLLAALSGARSLPTRSCFPSFACVTPSEHLHVQPS